MRATDILRERQQQADKRRAEQASERELAEWRRTYRTQDVGWLTEQLIQLQDAFKQGRDRAAADLVDAIRCHCPAEASLLNEILRDADMMGRLHRGDLRLVPLVIGDR